jgi:glycosyltransferase involved in cell wall biosynthesis
MNDLPTVSIVIPTRDRPKDLTDLIVTILKQKYLPNEVVIVDDSLSASAKHIAKRYSKQFNSVNCKLKYVKGSGAGLTEARNLGVRLCKGNAILFLDDDTMLDPNVLMAIAIFLNTNTSVLGVQPEIISSLRKNRNILDQKFENAMCKVFL